MHLPSAFRYHIKGKPKLQSQWRIRVNLDSDLPCWVKVPEIRCSSYSDCNFGSRTIVSVPNESKGHAVLVWTFALAAGKRKELGLIFVC